jgi:ATP-dependent Clp protease protease subunit
MTIKRAFMRAHEVYAKARADLERQNGGKPFQMYAKKSPTVGELFVYEIIGEDWWTGDGVTAVKVKKALEDLAGVKTLNVFINSPGGDVFEAKAILTLLQRFDAEKIVHVDGIAASAATFIAMVGNRIKTAAHANWMIHEASTIAFGRAEDMRAKADVLDIQNRDMAELYAGRTKKTIDEMLTMMAAETWMSASDALTNGFTDEVVTPPVEEEPAQAAVNTSPLLAAIASTERSLRSIRQERRVEQFNRAGPGKLTGQPVGGSK